MLKNRAVAGCLMWTRTFTAIAAFIASGCAGAAAQADASEAQPEGNGDNAPSTPGFWLNDECPLSEVTDAEPFDLPSAEQALEMAYQHAVRCQRPGATSRQFISLVWSPRGCVERIAVGGNRPTNRELMCMIHALDRAKVAPFAGRPVRVHGIGTTYQGFSRVGPLNREIAQRFVRAHYPALRKCYEQGLRLNPTLEGRVSVAFAISAGGTVVKAIDAGSVLSDKQVIRCVVETFSAMRFPGTPGGYAGMVYSLTFDPQHYRDDSSLEGQ